MRTDLCRIDPKGEGWEKALNQVEKAALYNDLEKKQALQLRLLAEELLGMTKEIVGEHQAEFYVEAEGDNYKLHLMAKAKLDEDTKEELLSVSSTGKNAAAKGVMGKVRTVFESFLNGYEEGSQYFDTKMLTAGYRERPVMNMYDSAEWSLQQYINTVEGQKEEKADEWDELEKSIVAKLADDVTVSVHNKTAEIVISKAFTR